MRQLNVGLVGFGNVGRQVATALYGGAIAEARLVGIAARDAEKARSRIAEQSLPSPVVDLDELAARSDVVVECATGSAVPGIARAVLGRGKILVCISAGGLVETRDIEELAARHGGRVVIPNGALPALDMLRTLSETPIEAVHLVSVIRPQSLFGEKYALDRGMDFENDPVRSKTFVFSGTAREAARHFPRHMNIAVAMSLAGIGLDRTTLELWVDPSVPGAHNTLTIRSEAATVTAEIQNVPSADNPKTSAVVAPSILAAIRRFTLPIVSGC